MEDRATNSRDLAIFDPGTSPHTRILSGPTGIIGGSPATFTWTGSDDQSPTSSLVYAYRLDPLDTDFSAFGSATSKTYTGLANGSYTFYVKAKDEAGNESDPPASQTFTVMLGRDLLETFISDPPSTGKRGTKVLVTDTVMNQGAVGTPSSTARFYLSADGQKDAGDKRFLTSHSVPALVPGATYTKTVRLTIPFSTIPGVYYLLACADDRARVSEVIENNNCLASNTPIQVTVP